MTTGVAFLPMVAMIMIFSNLSNIVLMPRVGPKPLVTVGMVLAAVGMALLTRIGPHSTYAADLLPPLLVDGAGLGMVIAPSINTGTFGVAPQDAGVASASVNTGQQLGGSIGTSLLNTLAASATATYLAHPPQPAHPGRRKTDPVPGHAGAGAWVHHGVLVGVRDLCLRCRRGRRAVPLGAAVPPGSGGPGLRGGYRGGGDSGGSARCRPRMISRACTRPGVRGAASGEPRPWASGFWASRVMG